MKDEARENSSGVRRGAARDCGKRLLAVVITHLFMALFIRIFTITPLACLNHHPDREARLVTISTCIAIFTIAASTMFKSRSLELMMVSAAYGRC